MGTVKRDDFDFDEWAGLALSDAAAFERRREECIDAFLAGAPEHLQQRLRGLQFRIDMERSRSAAPLGAAVRLNSMMWASVAELRGALESLVQGTAPSDTARREATLLRFPRRS